MCSLHSWSIVWKNLENSRNITDALSVHTASYTRPSTVWFHGKGKFIFPTLGGGRFFKRLLSFPKDSSGFHQPPLSWILPSLGFQFRPKTSDFRGGFKNPFSTSFLIPQTSRPSQTDRGEASTGTVLLSYPAIPNPIILSSFNHLSMDKSGYPVCLMSPHQKSSPKWVICVINTKNHPKSTLQNHPLHETKTHPSVKTGYQHAPSCAGSKIWIPPAKPMSPWLNSKRSWQTPRQWSKRDPVRVVMEFWSEVMFGCFLQVNSPGQTTHVATTDFVRLHFFD